MKSLRGLLGRHLVHFLATLVCLFFVSTLRDVPAPQPIRWPVAPRLPPSTDMRDAALRVTVVDEANQPVSTASVRVFVLRNGTAYFAGDQNADGDGLTRFEALPRGEVWVLAYGAGRARSSARAVLASGSRALRLVLVPARALAVTVVDDSEQPVKGATVEVSGADPLPYAATTASDGTARVDRLGVPPYSVRVSAQGYDEVVRSGVVPGPAPLRVRLDRPATLAVHVVAEGGAADSAVVLAAGTGLWPARSTVTGTDGLALITGLRGGVYDLKARRGNEISRTELAVPVRHGERKDVTLELLAGKRVAVTVTEEDEQGGRPISGANVVLVEEGLSSFPVGGKTDIHGVADLGPVARQAATIFAVAQDFVPRTVAVDAAATAAKVVLLHGGAIVGSVVDDRGFPVSSASIEVVGTDQDGMPIDETSTTVDFRNAGFERLLPGPAPLVPMGDLGVMPGPIPNFPHEGEARAESTGGSPVVGSVAGRKIEPWVTRGDGTFRAAPVPPGRIQVIARHPGYVEAMSETITLLSGREARVHLVLREGGWLEGRVLEEDRTPVRGARVELAATHGALERIAYAADDGTFTFIGAPEEAQLSVTRPDAPTDVVARLTVSVPDRERREVEIVLPRVRESIALRVTDDRGYPVAAVEVHAASLELESALRRTLFTSDGGEAELRDAVGLTLRFTLRRPGKSTLVRVVENAPPALTFVMSEGIVGRGTVTGREGRDRLAGAEVTVHTRMGITHVHTDDEGTFVVRDLAQERVHLSARHPGYAEGVKTVHVEGDADHVADLGSIDLAASGEAEGDVVDLDDNPVAGARVARDRAPAYLPVGPLPPEIVATDRSGHFKLGGLPEGRVTLEAYAADLGRGQVDDIDIRAGLTTDRVKIVLGSDPSPTGNAKGGGSLAVTLGETGKAVAVMMVAAGSEAEAAGIEPGDEIVSVNGHEVDSIESARRFLTGPLGEDLLIGLRRDDEPGETLLRVRRERVRR